MTTAQPAGVALTVRECEACPLRMSEVGRVTDEDGSFRRFNHQIAAIGQDRFVVLQRHLGTEPPPILTFSGERLGLLGRKGNGPGEVGAVSWVNVLVDGNIELISRTRRSIFSPAGRHLRSSQLVAEPRGTTGVRLPVSGEFIANSIVLPPTGDRNPLFVYGADGRLVRSIMGAVVEAARPDRTIGPSAPRRGDLFWLAEHIRSDRMGYSLRLLDADGRAHIHLRHEPAWFRATAREGGLVSGIPWAVRETQGGQLVVLVAKPKASLDLYIRSNAGHPFDHFVAMAYVIDPESREVLASAEVGGFPQAILDDRHLVTSMVDADDVPTLVVWRIEPPARRPNK